MPIVTLTTDFGTVDPCVGVMKGVVLGHCPGCSLIDLTHQVPAQDVRAAAVQLRRSLPYLPAGSIHLAVVDPGVGSHRRALIVRTAQGFLVGPDNGIFDLVLEREPLIQAYVLPVPAGASGTFHGRDVFAPAAGRLAGGIPPEQLGEPIHGPLVELGWNLPHPQNDGVWNGSVVLVDHFGNVLTDLPSSMCTHPREVRVRDRLIRFAHTYSDAPLHELVALWSSDGFLEIGCNRGRASDVLGLRPGDRVQVLP
jgi:S-adenosylmethionine hydrolase